MDRMTLKEKMFNGDVVLDFNHGDNVLDLAKEKLWEYENSELSPSEVAALKAENAELKETVDIFDKREFRSKFLAEWREEYQKELDKSGDNSIAGYPDGDYIYKLYFESRDRAEAAEKRVKVLERALYLYAILSANRTEKEAKEHIEFVLDKATKLLQSEAQSEIDKGEGE